MVSRFFAPRLITFPAFLCLPVACTGTRRSGDVAEQDDSLVVHPATQAAAESDNAASALSDDSDEDVQVDSQGFWEAEAIVRPPLFFLGPFT